MFEPGKLKDLLEDRATARKEVAAPFSLQSLIAWLETKDPAGEYNYSCTQSCLLANYTMEMGGRVSEAEFAIGQSKIGTCDFGGWPRGVSETANPANFTNIGNYGAALTRAQAALERLS